VSRLTLLLDQVLNDSTYRDSARYFQKVIADTNGLSKAADLLERTFGVAQEDQQSQNRRSGYKDGVS
jgi:UDP:flavonoid glycosyltransferase YjiC (YdhE family)